MAPAPAPLIISTVQYVAGLVVLGILVLGGLGFVVNGLRHVNNAAMLVVTRQDDIGFLNPGTTEISGAVETDDPVNAPISGRDCAAVELSVEEYTHQSSGLVNPVGWHFDEVGAATRTAPFRVADETGVIPIETRTADEVAEDRSAGESDGGTALGHHHWPQDFDVDRDERIVCAEDETPPDSVANLAREIDGVDPTMARKYRYTESRLDPGTEVTVLGRVTTDHPDYPGPVLANRADHKFVLAPRSSTQTTIRHLARGIGWIIIGAGISGFFGLALARVLGL